LEESPIDLDEFTGMLNEAISDAESEIHRLSQGEDYFLSSAWLDMVQGENRLEFPDDIFVRDVRRLMYQDGSNIYPITRFRGERRFEARAFAEQFDNGADYKYDLENDPTDSQDHIILVPPARETSGDKILMHFLRCARQIPTTDEATEDEIRATKIDIPFAINFLIAHVKVSVLGKMHEPLELEMAKLQTQRQTLVDTLSGWADDDTRIVPDLHHYEESN